MKKYIVYVIAFICVFTISCKDNRMEGMYEDKVGFLKNGEQVISVYNAAKEIEFETVVYKSGVGNGSTKVFVEPDDAFLKAYNEDNKTALKLLPADSYTILNKEFQLNHGDANPVVKVKINVRKLETLQGIQNQEYALPLKLTSSGEVEVNIEQSNLILIPEVTGGIRPNSAILLFSKTFEELGINQTNHNTASLAVSSKYVFVNTRNEDLRYYDRFTGAYVGSIPLDFKGSLANFTVTNDDQDNLLVSNLRNAPTGLAVQTIYRIKGVSAPEKYIEFSHIYPNGRKMSVTGDLDKDAIITSTVEKSSRVLYWKVKNGNLLSQEPQSFLPDENVINWNIWADAVSADVNIDQGMYIVSTGGTLPSLGYFGKNGEGIHFYDLLGAGLNPTTYRSQSLAYASFNGAKYLAMASQLQGTAMHTLLLDVTKPGNLQLVPTNSKILAYKGEVMNTIANANSTADIHLKVAKDKSTMEIYSLGTNGSIVATQFDKKSNN